MKKSTVTVKLGRKQAAPVNVAAKALREGQFKARVESNPKAYTRRPRHKAGPVPPPAEDDAPED